MPSPRTFRLTTDDGATHVLCTHWCLDRWLRAHAGQDHGARLRTAPPTPFGCCVYCRWCGALVTSVDDCPRHSRCPDFDALATVPAQQAVALLRERLAAAELPDAAFEQLITAATVYRRASVTLNADLLVERLWDTRCDWLRD
jgi:hypothetical protein